MIPLAPTDTPTDEQEIARLEGALWAATAQPGSIMAAPVTVRIVIDVDRDGWPRMTCHGYGDTDGDRAWTASLLRRLADTVEPPDEAAA